MEHNTSQANSTITRIHDVIDIWQSDPILGPYIRNLDIDPFIPPKIVETFLFSLIRDVDALTFTLLDNSFVNLNDQTKKELSSLLVPFLNENNILDNIRIKLLNSRSSKGLGILSFLETYFISLSGSTVMLNPTSSSIPKVFSWKAAGVHFAQLLLMLREKKWIDFLIDGEKSLQEFATKLYHQVDFTSTYTSDSLYRDLKPNDSEPDGSFKERYSKAFAGGDFFGRIQENKAKRVRKSGNAKNS